MRITLSLGVFLLSLIPVLTFAATAPEIQTIRDNSVRAITQLQMYVILEKARERRQAADKAMASIDTAVAGINDPVLTIRWQKTRAALTTSPYLDGEINQRALYNWENEVIPFVTELDRRMPPDVDRSKKDLYELAARMQLMTIIYLRNSADPFGGGNYTGINSDLELSTLTQEFTKRLNAARNNPQLKAPLTKVTAKWAFLSQRIADNKSRNVPFIVDLYGRQIIDMLLAAANSAS